MIPPYRDAECRYHGGDPRFSIDPRYVDSAEAKLDDDGLTITLVSYIDVGVHAVSYPVGSLRGLAYANDQQVWVLAYDPEDVVPEGFAIELQFRNDYYAKVFVKRVTEAFQLGPPLPRVEVVDPDEE